MTKKEAIKQFMETNKGWQHESSKSLFIMWDGFIHHLHLAAKISDHTYNKWSDLPKEFSQKRRIKSYNQ